MISAKVLLTEEIASEGVVLLKRSFEVQIAPSLAMSDLVPVIGDADVLLVSSSEACEVLMKRSETQGDRSAWDWGCQHLVRFILAHSFMPDTRSRSTK